MAGIISIHLNIKKLPIVRSPGALATSRQRAQKKIFDVKRQFTGMDTSFQENSGEFRRKFRRNSLLRFLEKRLYLYMMNSQKVFNSLFWSLLIPP
jgi:hypothetical protein